IAMRVERKVVLLALLHANAEEPLIRNTDASAGFILHFEAKAISGLLGDAAGCLQIHVAFGIAIADQRPERRAIRLVTEFRKSGVRTPRIAPTVAAKAVTFRRTGVFESAIAD